MNYQEVKAEILQHLIEKGYTAKGKDAVYKIEDGSYILIKPRKHTIAPKMFFVDYGIRYQFDSKQKMPNNTQDCHLDGEFTNIINWKTGEFSKDHINWDTDPIDLVEMFDMVDNVVLPYIEMISKLSYIQENYPLKMFYKRGMATSLANHTYLSNLVNLN